VNNPIKKFKRNIDKQKKRAKFILISIYALLISIFLMMATALILIIIKV